jgi:hypothetical protein
MLFARHLQARNRWPATVTSYMAAIRQPDDFLPDHGDAREVAAIKRRRDTAPVRPLSGPSPHTGV